MDLYTYDRLADLAERFEGGIELLYIMQGEMQRGQFTADSYSPALYAAYDYLSGLAEELRQLKQAGGQYDR